MAEPTGKQRDSFASRDWHQLPFWHSSSSKDIDRLAVPYDNGTSLDSNPVSPGKTAHNDQCPFKYSGAGKNYCLLIKVRVRDEYVICFGNILDVEILR